MKLNVGNYVRVYLITDELWAAKERFVQVCVCVCMCVWLKIFIYSAAAARRGTRHLNKYVGGFGTCEAPGKCITQTHASAKTYKRNETCAIN